MELLETFLSVRGSFDIWAPCRDGVRAFNWQEPSSPPPREKILATPLLQDCKEVVPRLIRKGFYNLFKKFCKNKFLVKFYFHV